MATLRELHREASTGKRWVEYAGMDAQGLREVLAELLDGMAEILASEAVAEVRERTADIRTLSKPVKVSDGRSNRTQPTHCSECGDLLVRKPGQRGWLRATCDACFAHPGRYVPAVGDVDLPPGIEPRKLITVTGAIAQRNPERQHRKADGTEKVGYWNSADAEAAILKRLETGDWATSDGPWNVYTCAKCKRWHIGHVTSEDLAYDVVAGGGQGGI